jgi:hypothetical protein
MSEKRLVDAIKDGSASEYNGLSDLVLDGKMNEELQDGKSKKSPLYLALEYGHPEMIKYLSDEGAVSTLNGKQGMPSNVQEGSVAAKAAAKGGKKSSRRRKSRKSRKSRKLRKTRRV